MHHHHPDGLLFLLNLLLLTLALSPLAPGPGIRDAEREEREQAASEVPISELRIRSWSERQRAR